MKLVILLEGSAQDRWADGVVGKVIYLPRVPSILNRGLDTRLLDFESTQ